MNPQHFSISIPEPCNENWDAMSPGNGGRHCSACAKSVVDFTGKTPEEIKSYLISQKGKRTCGRVDSRVLKQPHKLQRIKTKWKTLRFVPLRYAAILIISAAIFLAGCEEDETIDYNNWSVRKKHQSPEPVTTVGMILDPNFTLSAPPPPPLIIPDSDAVFVGDGIY